MRALRFAVMSLCALVAAVAGFNCPARAQDAPGWSLVTVGVLAYRGTDEFQADWAPLRDHLETAVPGWQFEFIPVTLVSAEALLEHGNLDFLITNPGHFVMLEADYPMSVLATRLRHTARGERVDQFGSVIFTRADAEIRTLGDVAGHAVAAVDPDAFGGFQVAWRELDNNGVDVFDPANAVSFVGFPQDEIVMDVLEGRAEVGIVRSGLLEAMAQEGRISLGDIRVLNANADYTYPEQVSTQLYPEWPFLALGGVNAALRDGVARALLATSDPGFATGAGLTTTWEAPVSYHTVRDLALSYAAAVAPTPSPRPALWGGLAAILALGAALLWRHRGRPAQATQPDLTPAAPEPDRPALTRREAEVLDLVVDGRSTKQIAKALGISPKTVEFHRSNLLKKFDAESSIQLVRRVAGTAT